MYVPKGNLAIGRFHHQGSPALLFFLSSSTCTASNFREPRKPINPRPQSLCHFGAGSKHLSSHHETPHVRSGYPKIISKDYTRLSCFLFFGGGLPWPCLRPFVRQWGGWAQNGQLRALCLYLIPLALLLSAHENGIKFRHQGPLYPRHHPGIRPGLPNSLVLASQLRDQAITIPPCELAGTVYKSLGEETKHFVEARLDLGRVRYV